MSRALIVLWWPSLRVWNVVNRLDSLNEFSECNNTNIVCNLLDKDGDSLFENGIYCKKNEEDLTSIQVSIECRLSDG